jgi:AcrR family transcriptional regulator
MNMPRIVKKTGYREKATKAIIDEALKVFVKKGYNGTTMTEIAQNIGVSKGTLYQYFDSKEALFEGVLRKGVTDFEDELSLIKKEDVSFLTSKKFYDSLKDMDLLPSSLALEVLQETLTNQSLNKAVCNSYTSILSSFEQMLINNSISNGVNAKIIALGLLSLHEGLTGFEETGVNKKIIIDAWNKLSNKMLELG